MIEINMGNVHWGTDPVPEHTNARKLNLLDPESHVAVTVLFADTPLLNLVKELSEGLTEEQMRELAAFAQENLSGVILPGEAHGVGGHPLGPGESHPLTMP